MKKIIIGITVILALGLVGCSEEKSSNDTKNNIKTMSTSKAEKLDKLEYAIKWKSLQDDIFANYEYNERYSDSKVSEERLSGGDRDMYKDLANVLSTFRSEDEGINQLHDKMIELSTDVSNMINERIDIVREAEKIDPKGNMPEKEGQRYSVLGDMSSNQKEQINYIRKEIAGILGID